LPTGGLDVRIAQLVETASSLGKGSLKVMYPGTMWCGPGHTAPDEKTLGRKRYTDKCCREHDNCPLSMAAGEVMHDLKNNGIFTR
jgi:secretory phospholipase A2